MLYKHASKPSKTKKYLKICIYFKPGGLNGIWYVILCKCYIMLCNVDEPNMSKLYLSLSTTTSVVEFQRGSVMLFLLQYHSRISFGVWQSRHMLWPLLSTTKVMLDRSQLEIIFLMVSQNWHLVAFGDSAESSVFGQEAVFQVDFGLSDEVVGPDGVPVPHTHPQVLLSRQSGRQLEHPPKHRVQSVRLVVVHVVYFCLSANYFDKRIRLQREMSCDTRSQNCFQSSTNQNRNRNKITNELHSNKFMCWTLIGQKKRQFQPIKSSTNQWNRSNTSSFIVTWC